MSKFVFNAVKRTALAYCALGTLLIPAASAQIRDAKTLFHWSLSQPPAEDDGPDRIVTDRPHFSEASSLIGLGRVQLETGYTYFRDDDAGVVETHSFPEPLLRAGLFAEWFELRLGYNYLIQETNLAGVQSRVSGSDDMYLGAKLALTQQSGWLPEMAIFPQCRIPTGSDAFTSQEMLPGFNFAYSWVITDWLELECNTQLNRRRDDAAEFYMEFIQTVNFEYQLADRLGAFTEWISFSPCGALVAEPQHYFHGGFVYLLTDNMQLDIHSAVGLTGASDDLAFTGAGFSVRY